LLICPKVCTAFGQHGLRGQHNNAKRMKCGQQHWSSFGKMGATVGTVASLTAPKLPLMSLKIASAFYFIFKYLCISYML